VYFGNIQVEAVFKRCSKTPSLLLSRPWSIQTGIPFFLSFLLSSGFSVGPRHLSQMLKNADRTKSVLAIMGQGPGGIGHYQRPASHLRFTVLFIDTHSLSPLYHVHSGLALIARSTVAKLLVICHVILPLRCRTQLLDSIPIPQHLCSAERTTVTEIRRSRAAPRC
jgi:hypothetical protein